MATGHQGCGDHIGRRERRPALPHGQRQRLEARDGVRVTGAAGEGGRQGMQEGMQGLRGEYERWVGNSNPIQARFECNVLKEKPSRELYQPP